MTSKKLGSRRPSWIDTNGEIIEEKADVVREIFRLAADGWSNKEIADRKPALTPIGVRGNKAEEWNESTIDGLLKSYPPIGFRDCGDGTFDYMYKPIVEWEVWRKVQALRGVRAPGFDRSSVVLSGLTYCAVCLAPGRDTLRPLRYRGAQRTLECYNKAVCGLETISYDTFELLILEHLTSYCAVDPTPTDNSSRSLDRRRELSIAVHQMIKNVKVTNDIVIVTLLDESVSKFETPAGAIRRALEERPDLNPHK